MAIAAMKRLRVLALDKDRTRLLDDLQRLGCVEIVTQTGYAENPEWADLLSFADTDAMEMQSHVSLLRTALESVSRYSVRKKSLFTPRPEVSLSKARDEAFLSETLNAAQDIVDLTQKITQLTALEGRLQNQIAALRPWSSLDVPLDIASTRSARIHFGVCPVTVSLQEMETFLADAVPESQLFFAHSDSEQHYFLLVMHQSVEEETRDALKSFGVSRMEFKDVTGTARENIASWEEGLRESAHEKTALERGISDLAARQADLELAIDVSSLNAAREDAAAKLLVTGRCILLEGWVPAVETETLEALLDAYDCAYEARDPEDGDEPPILLQNGQLTKPFTMVTRMYGFPKYRNIDPNPLIAPFYAIFFGMMFADIGYGLVLIAIGLLVTLKLKPKGMYMRYMFPLMTICGVFSVLWGIIFGSFFGDIIETVAKGYFGAPDTFVMPRLLDPMSDPMGLLILACVMGAVHLLVGMAVKAYILIRDGKPWDAVMDVGSWWLLFAGIAVFALGGTYWLALAGAAALIATQGRSSKSIVGKLFGGIASLYDLTAYLSDILSYSRLMALGLAGGVLASVFNAMGALFIPSPLNIIGGIFGTIGFLAVAAFGHVFNMGMSVVGTYVHAARLMYIEYFGKFYEGGGSEFAPLSLNTKYVDILERE